MTAEALVVEPPDGLDAVVDAAGRAARSWGLSEPVLVRFGMNGVLRAGDVILRVSRATSTMDAAVHFAERLPALGIRAAEPARDHSLQFGDLSVTAWHSIDHDPDAPVDWERVGAMIARLHSLAPTLAERPLPHCADFPWWGLDDLVATAAAVDPVAGQGLARAIDDNRWWLDLPRQSPATLCHGDVHPGNVLVDADGPVLIDWDLLCVGPREWDHSALFTWTERWGGAPGVYESFAAGYGAPVDEQLVRAIAEMRLVVATVMRVRRGEVDPDAASEAARRLIYWRGQPDAPVWRAQ